MTDERLMMTPPSEAASRTSAGSSAKQGGGWQLAPDHIPEPTESHFGTDPDTPPEWTGVRPEFKTPAW